MFKDLSQHTNVYVGRYQSWELHGGQPLVAIVVDDLQFLMTDVMARRIVSDARPLLDAAAVGWIYEAAPDIDIRPYRPGLKHPDYQRTRPGLKHPDYRHTRGLNTGLVTSCYPWPGSAGAIAILFNSKPVWQTPGTARTHQVMASYHQMVDLCKALETASRLEGVNQNRFEKVLLDEVGRA